MSEADVRRLKPTRIIIGEVAKFLDKYNVPASLTDMRDLATHIFLRLNEDLLTPGEACEFLNISLPTLWRLVHEEGLPNIAVNPGKKRSHRRFPRGDLLLFKNQLKKGSNP